MPASTFEEFSEEDIAQAFQNAFFNRHTHRWERPYLAEFERYRDRGAFFLAALENARLTAHLQWRLQQLHALRTTQWGATLYVVLAGWYVLSGETHDLATALGVAFFGYLLANTVRIRANKLA